MGERGWSFIELLVCAAVLSLLAAAVLPKTAHWLEERRLDSEAACMVAELRLLQEMTRSASRPPRPSSRTRWAHARRGWATWSAPTGRRGR